jgi:hypothetical protein
VAASPKLAAGFQTTSDAEARGLPQSGVTLTRPSAFPISNSKVATRIAAAGILIFVLFANWMGPLPEVGAVGWGYPSDRALRIDQLSRWRPTHDTTQTGGQLIAAQTPLSNNLYIHGKGEIWMRTQ